MPAEVVDFDQVAGRLVRPSGRCPAIGSTRWEWVAGAMPLADFFRGRRVLAGAAGANAAGLRSARNYLGRRASDRRAGEGDGARRSSVLSAASVARDAVEQGDEIDWQEERGDVRDGNMISDCTVNQVVCPEKVL